MSIYRITTLAGGFGSSCPPPIVSAIWPTFDGWPVILEESQCLVQVPEGTPQPADLGPLVRVEEVPPEA